MIVLKSVIFALAVSTTVLAYPASKDEEPTLNPMAEVDFVPLEAQRPGVFPPDGVIDVDANGGGFFGNPFGSYPFPSVFDSFNALMTRMRHQLDQLLGRLPSNGGESPFPELQIPNVGDFDLAKGNTTSVTKIINGHKVTINETEYKKDNDNGGSFFKVRVVDVHPDTEGSTSKDVEGVVPVKDREPMDDEEKKIRDNEVGNEAEPAKLSAA
uniref:Icarapin-like n=1 Tax=Photinus pyralis TaxID=7054 RepID=A0A1Y1JZD0_PHOPY